MTTTAELAASQSMSTPELQPASVPRSKVVFITRRMSGHASAAGFDRLHEFVEGEVIRPAERLGLARRSMLRALRSAHTRSGSQWYHKASLNSELDAAWRWARVSDTVFHFLYGENCYRHLSLAKKVRRRNFIVSTYHTPPEKFAMVVRDREHIRRLDAVTVVSTVQLEIFSELIGPDRTFFLPHGIDVHYFSPGSVCSPRKHFECLFVGSHLRDFATLAEAARSLQGLGKFRFTVVTRQSNFDTFAGLRNVRLLSGLEDDQLLQLYRESDLLVLPLVDATANNSLLEALSCGLPVLSSDLQGTRDYVNRECAQLVQPGAAKQLAEAIEALSEDPGRLRAMAEAARIQALEFSWQNIARRANDIYRVTRQAG